MMAKKRTGKNLLLTVSLIVFTGIAVFALLSSRKEKQIKSLFDGTEIVFFCGGNQNDSYARIVYNGAKAAEKEFGVKVKYIWSGWNSKLMADQFKDAVASKPDGICMMGHPGGNIIKPLMDEAVDNGIIVTFQDTDVPLARDLYKSKGSGYVGEEALYCGRRIARVAIRKYAVKRGETAVVLGLRMPVTGLVSTLPDIKTIKDRTKRSIGAVDALLKGNLKVYAYNIPPEVDAAPESDKAFDFIKKVFSKHPDIKILTVDHGGLTSAVSGFLKQMKHNPENTIVLGFDLSRKTVAGIEEGYLDIVSDQQPFLQGFFPILQVCLSKKYGFSGLFVDTGSSLVDKSNLKLIKKLAMQEIR